MQKNTPGRPTMAETEKTVKISVSLPFWIFEYLQKLENRSAFIAAVLAAKIKSFR